MRDYIRKLVFENECIVIFGNNFHSKLATLISMATIFLISFKLNDEPRKRDKKVPKMTTAATALIAFVYTVMILLSEENAYRQVI